MKIEFIQELVKLIDNSSLQELDYSSNNERIRLAKFASQPVEANKILPAAAADCELQAVSQEAPAPLYAENMREQAQEQPKASVAELADEDGDIKKITSTMIGTFYSKPSPDEEPYVKKGSKVKKGDVLCILESMKMMNEIKSPYDCEILETLATEEEVVEYGEELFLVRKS